jgi:hypothetical protein
VDDDDEYGENYILDMMLYLHAIDVQLFGKPFAMMQLEDSESIYYRKVRMGPLTIANREVIEQGTLNLSGNGMAWNTECFSPSALFDDLSYGAADTTARYGAYSYAVAMDHFNLLTIRKKNQSEHTWKVAEKHLLQNSPAINAHKQDVFL